MITHPFKPLYSHKSKILILGSFPSVKSRENNFYYLHPQNRFWKIIASIYNETLPESIDDRRNLILKNNLALWDVIKSCDIVGSSDSSIQNVKVNDIETLINNTDIKRVVFNGKKAYEMFKKYNEFNNNIEYICMPSTSPANAQYSFERLCKMWKKCLENV